MIDMYCLQNEIVSCPQYIEQVLSSLGHQHIVDHNSYYSCQNLDGDNPTAINIFKDNLFYKNYTRNKSGSIYNLVAEELNITFSEALKWVSDTLGLSVDKFKRVEIKLPFNGFYKGLGSDNGFANYDNKTYTESDLPDKCSLSKRFLDDGISLQVQEKYGVRYSHEEDAVLIPINDIQGHIVGCKARNNNDDDYKRRYYAFIPYQKTRIVYGLYQNINSIISKKTIIIVEAEKSVLQAASFNCFIVVAIGGHSLSNEQITIIKGLMCEKIIIGYDEGIEEEELIYESNKLKMNGVFNNKVGYIYDDASVRCMGAKESPTDLGEKAFMDLIKNYVRWI